MHSASDASQDLSDLRNQIIGLGESSLRKSYYPELQRRLFELHESQRFLETLMNNLPGMVYRCRNDPPRTMEFVSDGATDLTGFSPTELLAMPHGYGSLIHSDDRESVRMRIQQSMSGGGPFQIRYRIISAAGDVKNVEEKGQGIFSPAGELLSIEGFISDITEMKKTEDELIRRTIELEKAKELDQLKTTFINAISHDLRTPLTSVIGFAELLEDGLGGPLQPKQAEYVVQIKKSTQRLEYLVEDLLDLARIEAGKLVLKCQELDFVTMVKEVVESLRPMAEDADLRFELALPDDPLMVNVDPIRIERVLINLLNNAMKFTPPKGRILTRARTDGTRLICEIVDTGVGIAQEDVPKLFQRFSQLASGRALVVGTGLGLSISKSIVEVHGGSIGVRSELGKGSTFWFSLPLDQTRDVRGFPSLVDNLEA